MRQKLAGHPQIYEYLKRYQEDPTSRVFAPLAESYRKAGLVDEAIDIAREGLRIHPNFIGGRVALARALFDKKQYSEVIDELGKVVEDVPDNLVAQRLIAESYLMSGRVSEALSAYKMLLYFSPSDEETAKMVQELEAQAYEKGVLVLRTDPKQPEIPEFAEKSAHEAIESDPALEKARWIAKVERLQTVLQRVERYRARTGQL
ncbi:MAG: tetratricopeptide repeat protein [Bdellovibrionia bacterium]